jgi:hypothetical protein
MSAIAAIEDKTHQEPDGNAYNSVYREKSHHDLKDKDPITSSRRQYSFHTLF